jgi:hypothetical protein
MSHDPLSTVASWIAKAKDEPVSDDDLKILANTEFEAADPEIWKVFSNPAWQKECRDLGIIMRLASACLCKTKTELMSSLRGLIEQEDGWETFSEFIDSLSGAIERFQGFAKLLEGARSRGIAVVAALAFREEGKSVAGFGEPGGQS